MIPKELYIEGLYSYQKGQTIFFQSLTEAGLFGIFGSVGSGKSSILEAITFALFGKTERLNSQDKLSYNLMNLKSNRIFLKFDFINYENKIFRATREYKRNSKRFEDVKTPIVVFYEKIGEDWVPLPHTNAELILGNGMNYENFKRTIIIPQGQFKEFLELGATDRTKMMKEIFSNLSKFDLQDPTNKLMSDTKTLINQLEGELKGYDAISAETLTELESQQKQDKIELDVVKVKFDQIKNAYQEYLNLRKDYFFLLENKEKLKTLEAQKENINELTQNLSTYEKVFSNFHLPLKNQKDIEIDLKNKSKELEELKESWTIIDSKLKTENEQLKILKPKFEKLEIEKQKANDLESLLKLKELINTIDLAKNRTKKGIEVIEELNEKEKELVSKIESFDNLIELLKKKKMDSNLVAEISKWYLNQVHFQEQRSFIQKKIEFTKTTLEGFDGQLNELNVDISTFEGKMQKELNSNLEKRETLKSQLSQKLIEQKLSEYAHTLHDGEPCPLCGALEHPTVSSRKEVSTDILSIQDRINKSEEIEKSWKDLKIKVDRILDNQMIYKKQLDDLSEELSVNQTKLELHVGEFKWKEFKPNLYDDFEQKRKDSLILENEIGEKEIELKLEQESLEKLRDLIKRSNEELNKLENVVSKNHGEFDSLKSTLKVLKMEDFISSEKIEIEQLWVQLKSENRRIEQEYNQINDTIQKLNQEFASLDGSIKTTKKSVKEFELKSENLTAELEGLLKLYEFDSILKVKEILSQDLDSMAIKSKIEQFKIDFETLKNEIEKQKQKLKDFHDSEEIFEGKTKEFQQSEFAYSELFKLFSQKEAELIRLKKAFEDKKELIEKQSKLQLRFDNLQTLSNLFRKQGFVEYASSIYLRQLCDNANVRFHRMTRNQLSLSLNENNNFEVIDNLNEGKSRSVKTLSGGQSFQVSLSLALALAESVQSHNQSNQNFFFIDEGFGTQDTESVNIVFETLQQLQKENRIVGIISHVDELKERMPISLQITKDEEKGSLIEYI